MKSLLCQQLIAFPLQLLNKLKSLDELLSTKSKEILENVAKTDNKISNETVLVKNLINDFYLVGHKQFTENRVEEENESKHYKTGEHEESFKQSLDSDGQIHEQMKSVLNNSLKFAREKLKDLQDESSDLSSRPNRPADQLNQDEQVERLIRLNRYHRKRLPPIVDSEEFISEVFNLVKQSSTAKKSHTARKSTDQPGDLKANASESSSVISDLENISINERILEIHENNFVERLSGASTARQSSISFEDVKIPSDSSKPNSSTGKVTAVQPAASSSKPLDFTSNSLDPSQTHKRREDKIGDSVLSNENSLRKELDAIFGKAGSRTAGDSAKNRIFEDDSDDELFQPASSQSQPASKAKDLFGSDSDESEFNFDPLSGGQSKQKSANLFKSNVRSTSEKKTSEKRPETQPTAAKSAQSKKKSDVLTKLFDSDSEDDELFSSRSARVPVSDQTERKDQLPSLKATTTAPTSKASSVEQLEAPIETEQRKETNLIKDNKEPIEEKKVSEPIEEKKVNKLIRPALQPEPNNQIPEASSSSRESLFDESAKMPNKKDLFKNQLEDLFSKKRNPSSGFVKVNREKEDSLSEDIEKAKDLDNIIIATSKPSPVSSISKVDPVGQRKEFDLFGTKPSENLTADDLSSLNDLISTLDNNLVKSRIRFTNRKRPTKMKTNLSRLNDRESDSKLTANIEEQKQKIKEVTDPKGDKKDLPNKNVVKKTDLTTDKHSTSTSSKKVPAKSEPARSAPTKNEPAKDASTANATSKDATPKATKKNELFSDSDDDEFFEKTNRSDAKQKLKESLDQKFAKLFDDSDDDQLFTSPSTKPLSVPATTGAKKSSPPTLKAKESVEAKKKVSNLFDDDSDYELFFRKK